MRQVNQPTLKGEVVNHRDTPKNPIDKRWFIIGGLIIILVAVLVTLLIINNSRKPPETASAPEAYQSDLLGQWACTDGTVMSFFGDKTYTWTISADSSAESGNFSESGNTLSLERLSLVVGTELVTINQTNVTYTLTQSANKIKLQPTTIGITYSCTRSNND